MKQHFITILLFALFFLIQNICMGNGTVPLYSYYNSYDNHISFPFQGNFVEKEFYEEYVEITNNDIDHKKEILLHFDNGITLSLRPIKREITYFDEEKDADITAGDRYPDYILLCPCKKHVLSRLPIYDFMLSDQLIDYDFDLVKLKDYKNVTTYSFITKNRKYGESSALSRIIWLTKNDNGYCGSLNYYQMPLKVEQITEEGNEYYNYIKDVYIDIINDETNDFDKSLDYYIRFGKFSIMRLIHYISYYDEKEGDQLKLRYSDLINKQNGLLRNGQIYNQELLMRFSSPIWQIAYEKTGYDEWCRDDLPLKGGLPRTEEELEVYLSWVAENRYVSAVPLPLKDVYGEPVKFTLEEEGLRASSSGIDKTWGTDDDQTYLSKYSEIDMLLGVNQCWSL